MSKKPTLLKISAADRKILEGIPKTSPHHIRAVAVLLSAVFLPKKVAQLLDIPITKVAQWKSQHNKCGVRPLTQKKRPRNRKEVADQMALEGYIAKDDEARAALIEYRLMQERVQENMDREEIQSRMPPCYECPHPVYYYCEQTGTECLAFSKYCNINSV